MVRGAPAGSKANERAATTLLLDAQKPMELSLDIFTTWRPPVQDCKIASSLSACCLRSFSAIYCPIELRDFGTAGKSFATKRASDRLERFAASWKKPLNTLAKANDAGWTSHRQIIRYRNILETLCVDSQGRHWTWMSRKNFPSYTQLLSACANTNTTILKGQSIAATHSKQNLLLESGWHGQGSEKTTTTFSLLMHDYCSVRANTAITDKLTPLSHDYRFYF